MSAPRPYSRLTVGQWFAIASAVLGAIAVAGVIAGLVALHHLGEARRLVVDRIDPAIAASLSLANALVNQETGVRGFVLAGDDSFLDPYRSGMRREVTAEARLARLADDPALGAVRDDLAAVKAAARRWRIAYAAPTVLRVSSTPRDPRARVDAGRESFNEVRRALGRQQQRLAAERSRASAAHRREASHVRTVFIAFGIALLGSGLAIAIALQRAVTRPLGRLSEQVRRVAQGQFGQRVDAHGPRDVGELAADVNTMRLRIVTDLEASRAAEALLDQQARELGRSNAELEQFAYVASHDLQEPLRKVASFTQLLQRRYGDQLDERADEYIAYAVDGAKRMQGLINDLLAFSRAGRTSEGLQDVHLTAALRAAEANLATAIAESGARIEADALPVVRGEPSLLALVFQNLIGNAVKFRRPDGPAPEIHIGCRRDGAFYELSCADGGIGIEAEYAERIFVIFQRLHPKERYTGTGIGLAMCRKIVEYHGGRIWLDVESGPGTTFRFTLPVPDEETTT